MSDVNTIVQEATDDFDWKDAVIPQYPAFTFRVVTDKQGNIILNQDLHHGGLILDVFTDADPKGWIGRIFGGKRLWDGSEHWETSSMPEVIGHERPSSFKSKEEAAGWLWDHRNYMSAQESDSVTELVNELIEGEDIDIKDYDAFNPVYMVVHALKDAGFDVVKQESQDLCYFVVTWPTPNTATYIGGAKRVKEIISPYLNVRNWTGSKHNSADGVTGRISFSAPIEEDPTLWKMRPRPPAHNQEAVWYDVIFNGQPAGRIYGASVGIHGGNYGAEEISSRVREEMVHLHKIEPFDPSAWPPDDTGNGFGYGPPVKWWRQNRNKLRSDQKAAEHYADKALLGE